MQTLISDKHAWLAASGSSHSLREGVPGYGESVMGIMGTCNASLGPPLSCQHTRHISGKPSMALTSADFAEAQGLGQD